MKRCLKCNSLMPDDATRCVQCGFESAQKSAATPAALRSFPAAPGPGAGGKADRPGRIRGGWMLVKQSWRVLMLDKELLLFPLLSGIACFLVLAGFGAGIWASGIGQRESAPGEAVGLALLFGYYFVNYFVIVFFNSALVACAMIRFQGGNPTVRDGLRAAGGRLAQIVAWALLAASVGVALRVIEQRVQLVGRIVIALLGAAWTIATYFVVPVLVVEKLGPVDALKRSVMIIKKAWGESLVSNVGIGLITSAVTFAFIIVIGIATAVLAVQMGSVAVALAGAGVILVFLVLVALVSSALNSIVLCALYLYAAENRLPDAFEGTPLREAFVTR